MPGQRLLGWGLLLAGVAVALLAVLAERDDPPGRVSTDVAANQGTLEPADPHSTASVGDVSGGDEPWRWAVPIQRAPPTRWVSVGEPADAATVVVESASFSERLAGVPRLGPTAESAGSSISDVAPSAPAEGVVLGLCCEPVSGHGVLLTPPGGDAQDLPLQGWRFDVAGQVAVSVDRFGSIGVMDLTDPGSAVAVGETGGIDVAATVDGSRVTVLTDPKRVEAQVGWPAETDGQQLLMFERAERGLVEIGREPLDARACAVTIFGGTTALLMADAASDAARCEGSTVVLGAGSTDPSTLDLAEPAIDLDGDASRSNLLVVGSSGALVAMDLEGGFVPIAPAASRTAAAW